MPTIKTKKEMTLPQLIEWAGNNKVTNQIFRADKQLMNIQFDEDGDFKTYGFAGIDTTFTVEVEEPIIEDMKFHIVERFISSYENKYKYTTHHNKSIKDILKDRPPHVETTHIYAEIDNDLVLIWRDGKLVE